MKNSMQDVYIKFQKDSTGLVSFFKENVNGVSTDKTTGARTPIGSTMFVFRTELDSSINVVRGKDNNDKTRQAVYSKDYLNKAKALKWLKKRVTEDSLQELAELGYSDIWTNPDTLAKAFKEEVEINVALHIVQQDFAVNLVRYKAGKHAECLNSYKQSLARYADSDVFQTRFTNHILQAVMSVDRNLIAETSGKLRDVTTGKFNVALLETLDADLQAKIAQQLDAIMFGKLNAKKELVVAPKLKALKSTILKSAETKEPMVSYKFVVDSDESIALYPDVIIKIDTDDKDFVAYRASETQQRNASTLDSMVEESSNEEETTENVEALLEENKE
jgi:hypothetical protein